MEFLIVQSCKLWTSWQSLSESKSIYFFLNFIRLICQEKFNTGSQCFRLPPADLFSYQLIQ